MADAFFTRAPSTIVTIPLNGQLEFTIPFEFLARKFVVVTLLGTDRKVLTMNTDYRFIAVNKISLTRQPDGSYTRIELRRVTSATDRLVNFIDGSILRAVDLNLAQVQTMHVAEEARDMTSDNIGVNDDGNLDARNRKIVNLADATDPLDAVNLGQLRQFDTSTGSNADKAQAAAAAAKVSETNAKNSENRSVVAEAKAVSSAGTAMTAASDANNSKLAAKQSADAADVSEANALSYSQTAKNEADRSTAQADRAEQAASSIGDAVTLRGDLAKATGSELVGYQVASGKPTTTVALKLREKVTIKDFGGVGNDSADNTAAFRDAVAWMLANGRNVKIPEGSFITDPFDVYAQTYAQQIGFVGEDKQRSIIKRLSNGTDAFITFGDSAQTLFCVTNPLTNLTVNGGANTNGDTVVLYDLVRSSLDNVKFSGGTTALRMYGGISSRITNFILEAAKVGFKATRYPSSVGGAGGGWPNLITLSGGELVDNTQWGAYFDDGRMLRIRDADIEGNGSSGFNGGGLYVGGNVGGEVTSTNELSLGVLCDNVWFESNVGVFDFGQGSAYNRLSGCTFHSIGTVNDFAAIGGRYKLSDCDSTFVKTNNLFEGAGVLAGNLIERSEFPNVLYDPNKTEVHTPLATNLRNGGIVSATGYGAPRELSGEDNVGPVSNITFNPPFKTGTKPRVYTQVLTDDGTANHYSVEVFNITNTGFTMRKKRISAGTATPTNYNVMWRAIGEAN
ncbi:tail fiber protein [Aeromonas phage vB_ AhaP_PT2]|uniref:Tail fiber protein n=1 Tax=Aeromonas phage vB_ AhaP_PT2 TaxID=2924715 RepID=A0AC61TT87_9CAUD|nr:tail fiber protein [Aeromonas phage vB_ AhaP_PT2]